MKRCCRNEKSFFFFFFVYRTWLKKKRVLKDKEMIERAKEQWRGENLLSKRRTKFFFPPSASFLPWLGIR